MVILGIYEFAHAIKPGERSIVFYTRQSVVTAGWSQQMCLAWWNVVAEKVCLIQMEADRKPISAGSCNTLVFIMFIWRKHSQHLHFFLHTFHKQDYQSSFYLTVRIKAEPRFSSINKQATSTMCMYVYVCLLPPLFTVLIRSLSSTLINLVSSWTRRVFSKGALIHQLCATCLELSSTRRQTRLESSWWTRI